MYINSIKYLYRYLPKDPEATPVETALISIYPAESEENWFFMVINGVGTFVQTFYPVSSCSNYMLISTTRAAGQQGLSIRRLELRYSVYQLSLLNLKHIC